MFDKKKIPYEDLGLKIKNSVRDVRVALKSKKNCVVLSNEDRGVVM